MADGRLLDVAVVAFLAIEISLLNMERFKSGAGNHQAPEEITTLMQSTAKQGNC